MVDMYIHPDFADRCVTEMADSSELLPSTGILPFYRFCVFRLSAKTDSGQVFP